MKRNGSNGFYKSRSKGNPNGADLLLKQTLIILVHILCHAVTLSSLAPIIPDEHGTTAVSTGLPSNISSFAGTNSLLGFLKTDFYESHWIRFYARGLESMYAKHGEVQNFTVENPYP